MDQRLTRVRARARGEAGFTLIELIVTMALMLVVLTAVSATFVSGTHSSTTASNRIRSESDARQALSRMRDDLHCSFAVTSITQNSLGGFTLTMTEFFNTCKAVDQAAGSGSKVLLSWCTVPSPTNSAVFNLYRENTTCDTSGTRIVASDIVAPAGGWPQNTAATGVGGVGSPTSWAGNIWPTTPTCQLGYLQTQAVDMAVNPDFTHDPNSKYELKDQIALRNSTRCGTGAGTLATPSLTVSAPSTAFTAVAITPSATVASSSNDTGQITFFYWKQPTAPTVCTAGGTTVGTAGAAGDGTYPSSLSYTTTTAGDHIWWYAEIDADANNIAMTSMCGPGMPSTTVTNLPSNPTLTVAPPATGTKGVAIAPSAIAGVLAGSSGTTAGSTISFRVFGPQASAPTVCTSGGTLLAGTASPTGDGPWTPSAGYTPPNVGTYWWYASFSGDANDNPATSQCGAGMPSTVVGLPAPTLTIAAPSTGSSGTAIGTAAITATIAGATGATTAATKIYVYGPSAVAPGTCTGAGWTQVGGTITPSGNGAYHPSAGYTPPLGGTYWWYATYAGDASNAPTQTACSGSMTTTSVSGTNSFTFSGIGTPTAGGGFSYTLTAAIEAGGPDLTYSGTKCITFTGPANSPNATAPTYPARGGCALGQSSVTFASGTATVNTTLFNAAATNLTATQGVITGTAAFNVNAGAPSIFIFTNCSANGGAATNPCGASVSVGNGGFATLRVSVGDAWGNIATVTGGPLTVNLSNSAPAKFSLSAASVSIPNGASESNAVTATNLGNNNSSVISTNTLGFTQDSITVQK